MSKAQSVLSSKLSKLIEKGLTKSELSRTSRISRTAIDKYISMEVSPTLDALDKIADALGCDPSDLIKDDSKPLVIPHSLEDCLEAVTKAAKKGRE